MSERSVALHSGNQSAGEGSSPIRSLHFMRVGLSSASSFVKKHHYSHSHPGGIDYCFAINSGMDVLGVCMFGFIAGNPKAMCVCKESQNPSDYRQLMRLVLLDRVPKNSESRFIGWCLRWLKTNTQLLAIVSFADPKYGHVGTVYQATNWLYAGIQKPDRPRLILRKSDLFGDFEKEIHPKQAYNKFGSSGVGSIGEHRQEFREPKHRYIYLLRENLTPKYERVVYPKMELK